MDKTQCIGACVIAMSIGILIGMLVILVSTQYETHPAKGKTYRILFVDSAEGQACDPTLPLYEMSTGKMYFCVSENRPR